MSNVNDLSGAAQRDDQQSMRIIIMQSFPAFDIKELESKKRADDLTMFLKIKTGTPMPNNLDFHSTY